MQTSLFVPDDLDVATAIRPNLVAVVAALALAWVITLSQHLYDRRAENGDKVDRRRARGEIGRGGFCDWSWRLV